MAKRASISRNCLSSSTSETSASTPTKNIVLRIKSAQNPGRKGIGSEDDEVEERPSSKKRPKSTLKRKPTKKKIDANKPKKPPTAFFYFLEDFRKGFQEENPQVKSMRDVGKACGEKWKTMTYEEKVKYYDIATEKRAEFDRAMTAYLRRKERGEDAIHEDSESEFDGE